MQLPITFTGKKRAIEGTSEGSSKSQVSQGESDPRCCKHCKNLTEMSAKLDKMMKWMAKQEISRKIRDDIMEKFPIGSWQEFQNFEENLLQASWKDEFVSIFINL